MIRLSQHIDGLYSYALALSRSRVEAEDLVQETYVRAIPAVRRLRKESDVKGWMFAILRNIWLNQLRQPEPHARLLTSLEQDQVRQAISRLPVESREVILLREFEDLSYQEIAGVLKCPISTVMSRLGRARSELRAVLSSALADGNAGEHA